MTRAHAPRHAGGVPTKDWSAKRLYWSKVTRAHAPRQVIDGGLAACRVAAAAGGGLAACRVAAAAGIRSMDDSVLTYVSY